MYVSDMIITVKNAAVAALILCQLILAKVPDTLAPTMIRAPPVAQGGIDAKMGAKKMLKRNKRQK
jgi:hypothetical protein